jgi:hypothetical protein
MDITNDIHSLDFVLENNQTSGEYNQDAFEDGNCECEVVEQAWRTYYRYARVFVVPHYFE